MRSHRLRDLAEAFGVELQAHRAAGDTEAVFRVWRIALAGLADLPLETLQGYRGACLPGPSGRCATPCGRSPRGAGRRAAPST